jgi:hypothetical protein
VTPAEHSVDSTCLRAAEAAPSDWRRTVDERHLTAAIGVIISCLMNLVLSPTTKHMFVCLIPLLGGVEQSWQGDFLSLARNFRGCIMQGRKTAKGSKNRIENRSHHHQSRCIMYASSVLCFLVLTCRLCMYPHTRGPVIYPLSIKH